MHLLLRFGSAAAIVAATAVVSAQNGPPAAPAPGRAAPTSPEAAPSTPPQPTPARKFPTPAGNPTTDNPTLTTNARAQADAEHQAARARCEVLPKSGQEACLRDADERYDRALAGENPGEQGNPGSNTGAKGTGLDQGAN